MDRTGYSPEYIRVDLLRIPWIWGYIFPENIKLER